jgi:hypothetical protein
MRQRNLSLYLVAVAGLFGSACDFGDTSDDLDLPPSSVATPENPPIVVKASEPIHRNLSNREYLSMVSDVIGVPLDPALVKSWTATTQFSGFDAVAWTSYDGKALRDRTETLEFILDRAVGSKALRSCSAMSVADLAYTRCAQRILEPLAARAFGRPLEQAEKDAIAKTYDGAVALAKTALSAPADILQDGIRAALGSILIAPQAITRIEPSPSPGFVGERELNAYELANRLSFMMLNSIPDEQLWAKAADGTLVKTEVLRAEVNRLLDSKTETFVQSFMGQWFDFRAFDTTESQSVERAMWNESWRTLSHIVRQDMPAAAILQPGFTYLNGALAKHYGLPGTFGVEFTKLTTVERGGVLQQGSWLTLSATPLKTSPMHRGRLVQDRLLCKAIPPPDSALFAQIQAVSASIPANASVKERLLAHRNAGAACRGCHEYMDPIGLGLESFDSYGKFRTVYSDGKRVEAESDILGKPFRTVRELGEVISGLPDYRRCVAQKLAIYSLRTSSPSPELLDYVTGLRDNAPVGVREMIVRTVQSNAFRKVRHRASL